MKYIKQLAIIMLITFIAELIKVFLPLPIPSGIYGLILLFCLLCFKIVKLEKIEDTANFFIAIMGIMFIPAGVGIINNTENLLPMLAAIVLSTVVVTALVMGISGKITDIILKRQGK